MRTGDIKTARLSNDRANDLLGMLHDVTGKTSILIFDAVDQLKEDNVEVELGPLHHFLCDLPRLPPLHAVIAVRDNKPFHQAYVRSQRIEQDIPEADRIVVEKIDYKASQDVSNEMIQWLHQCIPVTQNMKNDEVLQAIEGYPYALEYFTRVDTPDTDSFVRQAKDAHAHRFPEIGEFSHKVVQRGDDVCRLLARLSLFPEITSKERWDYHRPMVMEGIDPGALLKLQSEKILYDAPYPTFGHTTRYEYAKKWWLEEDVARPYSRTALEHIIRSHAKLIRSADLQYAPASAVLAMSVEIAEQLNLSDSLVASCLCVYSLFGESALSSVSQRISKLSHKVAIDAPESAVLLAMSLANTISALTSEQRFDDRDNLLRELRDLADKYPDDAEVRENLAKGLYNTLIYYKSEERLEERDNLLQELRDLADKYPDDTAVRERLAKGLYNTLIDYKSEQRLQELDKLIEELGVLLQTHSDDPWVKDFLSQISGNASENE